MIYLNRPEQTSCIEINMFDRAADMVTQMRSVHGNYLQHCMIFTNYVTDNYGLLVTQGVIWVITNLLPRLIIYVGRVHVCS